MAGVVDDATARVLGPERREEGAAAPTAPDGGGVPREPIDGDDPAAATKAGHRRFYDDVTRQLDQSGVADASFFLNYGYIGDSDGDGDEAAAGVPEGVFNAASVRLAYELVGATAVAGRRVLDVGCGRGGTVALLATELDAAEAVGVDLSPEAVEFCRRTHRHEAARFEVGDAEQLPFEDARFDVVTNLESSHTYPNLRAFLSEVARVLVPGGRFLHADLLPVERWVEVRVLLEQLGLDLHDDRDITANVLASCDQIAAARAGAFVERSAAMDNFLAVPGSVVYEQMRSAAWEYRILRSTRRA
jgi:SAM-dependent methyltransferase